MAPEPAAGRGPPAPTQPRRRTRRRGARPARAPVRGGAARRRARRRACGSAPWAGRRLRRPRSALEEVNVDEKALRLRDLLLPARSPEPDAAPPAAAEPAPQGLEERHRREP